MTRPRLGVAPAGAKPPLDRTSAIINPTAIALRAAALAAGLTLAPAYAAGFLLPFRSPGLAGLPSNPDYSYPWKPGL